MKKRVNIIIPFITFFFISVMALAFGFLFAIIYPAMGLDIEKVFEHIGITFLIAFAVTIIVAIILYRFLKPIDRIVNNTGSDRELTIQEKEKIIKTEKNIKFILILITVIGFILAPLAATISTTMRTGLLRWSTVRFLIVSWSLGPTAAFFLILFFSYIMHKIKVACRIYEFSLQKHRNGIKTELIATLVCFSFTAIVILVCQSITREELIAGVSHVAVYLNDNASEQTDGHFSRLLRLSQESTDSAIKQEAEAIINNWQEISIKNNLNIIMIGAISFAFICLCIIFYASNISSQLRTTRSKLKTVVGLEGDLTNLLVKTSDNEIGDIQVLFNLLIININRTLKNIFKVAGDIIGITKSEKKTIELLITANDEIKHTTKTVSQELSNQIQISKKTTKVVEEVIKLIKDNINKITSQAAMVEESSTAVNQMNSSIKSVSKSTQKATNLGDKLNQSSKQGIDVTLNMNESIADISKFGMSINEIVNTISTITSQTDLLAMNAAIEAAHAGQYGKGFAVVADEIRTLAETTAAQTKEIEAILDSMSSSIENSVSCSSNLSTRMNIIKEGVTNTISIINEINNAAQEQLANSNQNMTIVNELLNTTQMIMENLEKHSNMNEQLSTTSQAMKNSVQQIDDAEKEQEQYFNSLRASFENFIQFFNQTKESLNLLDSMLKSVKLLDDKYIEIIKPLKTKF